MGKWTYINEKQILTKEFDGKRVVTFKEVDLVHERAEGTASRNFRENRKRFIEKEDFYNITPKDFQSDEIRRFGINSPRGGILLTETGYLMLVKSFTDDLAWKVQRELVNVYFNIHHPKEEQPKIEAPHNIVKKFYNGSSVMVLKDLESILSVPVGNLSYYLRNNSSFKRGIDYFLLEGKELKRFKEYNNVSPFIGNLIIMPKQGVDKLIKLLVLSKKHIQEIEEYFKAETKDPYNNMPILEQLQVCKFIADDFKINEAIKMSIYKMICQKNGIDSEIVGMISIEETRDKFVKLAVEYLSNFTTDILIKAKKELIFRDEFISSPHETKGLILGFFDIVIEISKEKTKTAV